MTEVVIDIDRMRCRYRRFEAVRGVSLTVSRGELLALLGTNGAGKTTTIETLEGLRRPSAGLRYVDPALAADALAAPECPLTPRELGVLRLAGDGTPVAQIARRSDLSTGTVRNYLAAAVRHARGVQPGRGVPDRPRPRVAVAGRRRRRPRPRLRCPAGR